MTAAGAAVAVAVALTAGAVAGCSPQSMPPWSTPPAWSPPPPQPSPGSALPSALSPAANGQPAPGPEAKPPAPLDLTLVEAARLAFENNRNLRVRRLDPAIARTEIDFERAAFDPAISYSTAHNARREQILNNADPNAGGVVTGGVVAGSSNSTRKFRISGNQEYDGQVGLSQTLPTGTRWTLSQSWRLNDTNFTTPDHITQAGLQVVQPLLRGFGPEINLTGIEVATRQYELSRFQLETAIQDVVVSVERAYWDLVLAKANYAVQADLVELGRRRLAENQEALRLGKAGITSLTVAQDEAALAGRLSTLAQFANNVEIARLTLLRLVNPEGRAGFWSVPVSTYVPDLDPDRLPPTPDAGETTRIAMANRPEIKQAQIGVTVSELNLRLARNALLPQLDIAAGYGPTGHGANLGRAIRSEADWRFYTLNASATFSWTLGNRAAAARSDRADLTRTRAERQVDDTVQAVELDIRTALQNLDNAAKRYRLALETQARQRDVLDKAERTREVGLRGFDEFFILQFQDQLTSARLTVNGAVTDYLRALSDLRRSEGTILKYRGLEVQVP
jgi:outer membrane protein TolC